LLPFTPPTERTDRVSRDGHQTNRLPIIDPFQQITFLNFMPLPDNGWDNGLPTFCDSCLRLHIYIVQGFFVEVQDKNLIRLVRLISLIAA